MPSNKRCPMMSLPKIRRCLKHGSNGPGTGRYFWHFPVLDMSVDIMPSTMRDVEVRATPECALHTLYLYIFNYFSCLTFGSSCYPWELPDPLCVKVTVPSWTLGLGSTRITLSLAPESAILYKSMGNYLQSTLAVLIYSSGIKCACSKCGRGNTCTSMWRYYAWCIKNGRDYGTIRENSLSEPIRDKSRRSRTVQEILGLCNWASGSELTYSYNRARNFRSTCFVSIVYIHVSLFRMCACAGASIVYRQADYCV